MRSHHGILGAANAVVQTLHALFPGTVDKLTSERGAFDGTRPLLLPDAELHTLSRFVKAKMGTAPRWGLPSFGADGEGGKDGMVPPSVRRTCERRCSRRRAYVLSWHACRMSRSTHVRNTP